MVTGRLVLIKHRPANGLLRQASGSTAVASVRRRHEVLRALDSGVDTGLVLPSQLHQFYTPGEVSGDQWRSQLTWVTWVDGDARLDEAKAFPAGVNDDVGAEAGADHGDTLSSSLQQVRQKFELPVLAKNILPRRQGFIGGQWGDGWGPSEEVRKDAGQLQLLGHLLAIFLSPARVRSKDIVAPQQPFPTQRGTIPGVSSET